MWLLAISIFLLVYVYGLYPALCWVRARVRPKSWRESPEFQPSVSVLIAAFDEEREIRRRVLDVAEQQTKFEVEILVGSDGSSDGTVQAANAVASEVVERGMRLRVLDFPRIGKIATLARLIHAAMGDVLVFTDANTRFAPVALRAIIAPLADPQIGCSAGVKRISSGRVETREGEESYWNVENQLKRWESQAGSCAGADGALYAIRRSDAPQLVTNRLLADDFYISLTVCSGGRRCVQVPDAVAIEPSDTTARNELKRKARILAGALEALALNANLLVPGSGMSLSLWSHKVLRWFSFVPLCGMLIGALQLRSPAREGFYLFVALGLLLIATGAVFPSSLRLRPVKLFYYFALMNFGQVLGMLEWLRRSDQPAWKKMRA